MGRPLRERFDRVGGLEAVGLLCRLGLAAVWLSAGLIKAADPRAAQVAVRAYQIFPFAVSDLIGATLPYLEIGLGLLLLVGVAIRWVASASAVLLVLFVAGVVSAALRGLSIDCGCFGGGGEVAAGNAGYLAEVLRDIGFLVLAGFLLVRPRTPWSVDQLATPGGGTRASDYAPGDNRPGVGRPRSRLDEGSTHNRRGS